MSEFPHCIFVQLTLEPSWSGRYLIECLLLLLIVVLGIAVIVLWHRLRMLPVVTETLPVPTAVEEAPVEEPTPEEISEPDALPAADEPALEGAGHILVRLTELCQEFTLASQDVRQYSGTREMQIQGWQRLCADILRRTLPVLENIEPYLADENPEVSELAHLVHGRLMTELMTVGVRLITPEPGEPFNAVYHQLHPDTSGLPPYQVQAVVSPGFMFRSRVSGASEVVLKPADVIAETIIIAEPVSETEEPISVDVPSEEPLDNDNALVVEALPAVEVVEAASIPEAVVVAGNPAEDEHDSIPAEEEDEELIAPPLGGYDVLITPLAVDDLHESDRLAERHEREETAMLPPVLDGEDTASEIWMDDDDHRVWVVDESDEQAARSSESGERKR